MERMIECDGASLWTCDEGSGFPVMLCGGGPGCCDSLEPVAAMLRDRYRVIRFEERGCGRSERVPPYDFGRSARDMRIIRAAYGIERCVLCGHSAGVDLVLTYALERPSDVVGIIGIAGGRVVNDVTWKEEYRRRRGEELLLEQAHPSDPAVNAQSNAWWDAFVTDPTLPARLARLEVPAHFILAGGDIRPAWPTLQLAHLMPRGSYEIIEGAPHFVWRTHAARLGEALLGALGRVLGGV